MANPYEDDDVVDPFREQAGSNRDNQHYHDADNNAVRQVTTAAPPIDGTTPASFLDSVDADKPPATTMTSAARAQSGNGNNDGAAAATAATASATATPPTSRFWTLAYYQQFFDVTTELVLQRLASVFMLQQPPDFLRSRNWHLRSGSSSGASAAVAHDVVVVVDDNSSGAGGGANVGGTVGATSADDAVAQPAADLYGPFWLSTTLWMTVAVVAHVSFVAAKDKYIQRSQSMFYTYCCYNNTRISDVETAFRLQYGGGDFDFAVCVMACVAVYVSCFGASAVAWAVMRWKNLSVTLSDTVALYGYSMVMLEVAVMLCAVLSSSMQWLACALGCAWAIAYVLCNMWRVWRVALEPRWFAAMVALVVCGHVGLALAIKLYFLHYNFVCSKPC